MGYKNLVYWSPRRAEVGRCHVIRFQTHRHKMRTPSRGKMLQGKIFFHFLPLLSRVFESKCQNDALFYFHTPKINYVKAQHKILYQLADGGGGCKIYKSTKKFSRHIECLPPSPSQLCDLIEFGSNTI